MHRTFSAPPTPDAPHVTAGTGHGDGLAIVDAYVAAAHGRPLPREAVAW